MTSDKHQVRRFSKTVIRYNRECFFFLNTITIKIRSIQFTSITALFANYKHVGLCPTRNGDKSVSLTKTNYRPKKNASRTYLTNDDQKAYAFAPTYGDGSTAFHCHMISVLVYSYSNELQCMLVDYVVTEMG